MSRKKFSYVEMLANEVERFCATLPSSYHDHETQGRLPALLVAIFITADPGRDPRDRRITAGLKALIRLPDWELPLKGVDAIIGGKQDARIVKRVFNELYQRHLFKRIAIRGDRINELLSDIMPFLTVGFDGIELLSPSQIIPAQLFSYHDVRGFRLAVRHVSERAIVDDDPLQHFAMSFNFLVDLKPSPPSRVVWILDLDGMPREEMRRVLYRQRHLPNGARMVIIGRNTDLRILRDGAGEIGSEFFEWHINGILRFSPAYASRASLFCLVLEARSRRTSKNHWVPLIDCRPIQETASWTSREVRALTLWALLKQEDVCSEWDDLRNPSSLCFGSEAADSAEELGKRLRMATQSAVPAAVHREPAHVAFRAIREGSINALFHDVETPAGSLFKTGVDSSVILSEFASIDWRGGMVYIIGDNGAGKSYLLRDIRNKVTDSGKRTLALSSVQPDRFGKSKGLFRHLGALSQLGLARVGLTTRLRQIASDRITVFLDLLQGIGFSDELFLLGISATASGSPNSPHTEIRRLSRTQWFDVHDAEESLATVNARTLAVRKAKTNDIVPVAELSTGERSIVSMAAILLAEVRTGDVVLIDEPENFLHVSWQRAIPGMLAILCRRYGISCVIATHSPLLVCDGHAQGAKSFRLHDQVLTRILPEDIDSIGNTYFNEFRVIASGDAQIKRVCARILSEAILQENGSAPQFDVLRRLQATKEQLDRDPYRPRLEVERDTALVAEMDQVVRDLKATRPKA